MEAKLRTRRPHILLKREKKVCIKTFLYGIMCCIYARVYLCNMLFAAKKPNFFSLFPGNITNLFFYLYYSVIDKENYVMDDGSEK